MHTTHTIFTKYILHQKCITKSSTHHHPQNNTFSHASIKLFQAARYTCICDTTHSSKLKSSHVRGFSCDDCIHIQLRCDKCINLFATPELEPPWFYRYIKCDILLYAPLTLSWCSIPFGIFNTLCGGDWIFDLQRKTFHCYT